MKFQVGACALLLCLAGCSGNNSTAKFGDLYGSAAVNAKRELQLPSVRSLRKAADSIANAPDRGALVNYKNKGTPTKVTGAYTWYPVAISEEHALKAVVTGEMTIPSPDGSQVKLRYERHQEHPDGNWTWIGRVEGGDQKQEAILTFGEKAVFGSIPQPNGAPALSLETRNGVLWAVKTDPSKVKSANKGTIDIMVPPALALRTSLAASTAVAQGNVTQAAIAVGAPATSVNTIDVAIGYTQGFANALGGSSAAVTRLNFLISVGNQAFTNSQINGYLRLVNAVQVTYADNTKNSDALGQLTGNSGTAPVTIPASLVPLRTARDQYGADLAVLVRDFQTPENEGCGIAWLNGADQTAINPTTDDDFGFAVISDGYDTGTDNKEYFCAPETLVHELGHLMGSAHDRDNSKKTNGDLQFGRFAYSFGMKTTASAGNFYTIMAYGADDQNFYRTFSNPSVLKCGPSNNLSCGIVDQSDNARSLNQTILVVATFRANVIPHLQKLDADYNGDGLSDVFWRNSSTGENIIWWSANTDTRVQAGIVPGSTWQAVAAGDFGGDGQSDIFWRNSTTGENIIWRSGSPTTVQYGQLVSDANWRVAGSGDFNGDGKHDIFWRNSSTGANTIWWSGSSSGYTAPQSVPTVWSISGIGDFNADGQSDVFWRNSSSGENIIWFSANPATIFYAQTVLGATWIVAGAGDFNGDGKSDIFWRNSSSGINIIWWSGSFSNATTVTAVVNSWKIVATGDYNGDGKYDLLWRNIVGGDNSIWYSGTSTSFKILPKIADQTWSVKP